MHFTLWLLDAHSRHAQDIDICVCDFEFKTKCTKILIPLTLELKMDNGRSKLNAGFLHTVLFLMLIPSFNPFVIGTLLICGHSIRVDKYF